MKLNIIEDETKSMIIELIDADRGIADLIRDRLAEKSDIEFVSVVKTHPDVGQPRLVVKSSKNARTSILKALDEVADEIEDFAKQLPKSKK
ncbi:MAG: RpoL/Rpb11 RNA polymerase subunit family protein [Candidatus Micrarchaeaceae archaeon]